MDMIFYRRLKNNLPLRNHYAMISSGDKRKIFEDKVSGSMLLKLRPRGITGIGYILIVGASMTTQRYGIDTGTSCRTIEYYNTTETYKFIQ